MDIFGTARSGGDLVVTSAKTCKIKKRFLDLLHGVTETVGDTFNRTHFCSLKNNVLVSKIIRSNLEVSIRYDHCGGDSDIIEESIRSNPHRNGYPIIKDTLQTFENVKINDNTISYFEQIPNSIRWCHKTKIVTDGTTKELDDGLQITNASEIIMYTVIGTTMFEEDAEKYADKTLENAIKKGFETLLEEHKAEFSRQMTESELCLESNSELQDVDTDIRMQKVADGVCDPGFSELFFNYGKYLLISSSSEESKFPANLQGIWIRDNYSPWSANFHININLQMNYWACNTVGLSECEKPLFSLLKRVEEEGRHTAKVMYGCNGWMLHHRTTPWGFSMPANDPTASWGEFVSGGAWCATHIIEKYRYTKDSELIKEYYGLIRGAAEFFLDYLTEYNGYLITCPASSPENCFIDPKTGDKVAMCAGATMDTEIIRDLFEGILEIREIAEDDEQFIERIKNTLSKLPPLKIGKNGNICEWIEDYEESEPGHRHISHLYALHPARQITEETPELFEAARKTIERRLSNGGGHTGWSRAWIMNFFAKLKDGEECENQLRLLFTNSTYPNLWDKHPPFQIDGNFGTVSAICEMLLNTKTLELLPALPPSWKNGYFKNFRAYGNRKVSCKWEKGKVVERTVE